MLLPHLLGGVFILEIKKRQILHVFVVSLDYCISFVGPNTPGTGKPACRNSTVICPR